MAWPDASRLPKFVFRGKRGSQENRELLGAMPPGEFKPGFRLSIIDCVVLLIGAVAAISLARLIPWLAFCIAFVLGHFFLFCNVFRLARPLELAWAGLFCLSAYCTVLLGQPGWTLTTVDSLVATAAVVAIEMRKPSYHGVLWQSINPNLSEWWRTAISNDNSQPKRNANRSDE
jgi:hypothetical protein